MIELRRITAEALAAEWVACAWARQALIDAAASSLDRVPVWIAGVVDEALAIWRREAPPEHELADWLLHHPKVRDDELGCRVVRPTPHGRPGAATHQDLARLLQTDTGRLDWLGMRRPRETGERFYTYCYTWVPKARGGHRLLEAPKPRLKRVQRAVLRSLLRDLPIDEAAHGFVSGRSPRTFAAPHVGRAVVVRVDLADFFTSVTAARVLGVLVSAGFAPRVAMTLVRIVTVLTPRPVLARCPRATREDQIAPRARMLAALRQPHLAQGAPTSPALANIVAARLDRRARALAASYGATYTRYADDLAFSGDAAFERGVGTFLTTLRTIIEEEGFRVRADKTRVLRRSARQALAGVVVNERPTVARRDVELLEATLFNALRTSLAAQNRRDHPLFLDHLAGRVAHVASVDPRRARRVVELLRRLREREALSGA